MKRIMEQCGDYYAHFPGVNLGSSGPTRVEVDNPEPNFKARPVGFLAKFEADETDPLVWEGD